LDDFVADGVHNEVGEGMKAELEHDIGAVGFGGVDADVEERGDFLVALAFGEKLENFAFAGSEAGAGGFGGIGDIGDASGEIRLVLTEGVNGGQENTVGFVLEDVSTSASFDDLLNEFIGLVHGENEDFGFGERFVNAASRLDTVQQGHANIEDENIGLEFGGFFDGFAAVGCFRADFPPFVRFEQRAEAGADDGVVIRDKKT
jgi:hypothetical protein